MPNTARLSRDTTTMLINNTTNQSAREPGVIRRSGGSSAVTSANTSKPATSAGNRCSQTTSSKAMPANAQVIAVSRGEGYSGIGRRSRD